jgi:HD superfamily phosphohydrolase
MIQRDGGNIRRVLAEQFGHQGAIADDIAYLLTGKEQDLYSAVVSSSFDADRLDYLRRDRMMTGSGAGAIDFEWLLDNLRVVDVSTDADDDAGVASDRAISNSKWLSV